MSDYNGPIVHVEIYEDPDATSASRGFHGSLEWVYEMLGKVVADERQWAASAAAAEAFEKARAKDKLLVSDARRSPHPTL